MFTVHFSRALLSDDVIRVSLHEGRVRINWLRLDITHDSMGTGRGCCQILGVISGHSQLIRTWALVCVNRKMKWSYVLLTYAVMQQTAYSVLSQAPMIKKSIGVLGRDSNQ